MMVYLGTTFNRPGFNELLHDIENKSINMVITKDLSRLGRDYIKTGEYIENYFPEKNIRYVAITDGIDTYIDSTNNDITPFKAIMNDMYAKDISKKIRSVFREKQNQGENLCSIPAYGYKKHPSIKNKLVIDENVVDIVRKIFDMYANGHSTVEIANYLNGNKYLSPTGYRKTGIVQDKNKTGYNWNEVTICNILKNEVYIGNTVQNKTTVISYKVKKIKTVKKEDQIRVNNTHKPIIDKYIFEKVNSILEKRGTNTKFKYDYLSRGLIYCYHCKRKLQIVLKKSRSKNSKLHPYITCTNYKTRGYYPININYEKFEKQILDIVRKITQTYADKEMLDSVYERYKNKTLDIKEDLQKKIEEINKKICEINNDLDKMYTDKLRGIILQEDYIRYAQKITFERTNLVKQKENLAKKLTQEKKSDKAKEENESREVVENFLKLEQIDKIYLYRLINKIEIDKDKNVYIYFNFSRLNFMDENLDGFIKIEELLN